MYWTNVSFSEMSEYKPLIETREKVQVPIINLSSSPIIMEATDWLKKLKKK